ncbi:hypothetical protein ACS49_03830 [Bacillus cereus]|nr:hypothetical protein ACS49_03830 [Bacillus cereus]
MPRDDVLRAVQLLRHHRQRLLHRQVPQGSQLDSVSIYYLFVYPAIGVGVEFRLEATDDAVAYLVVDQLDETHELERRFEIFGQHQLHKNVVDELDVLLADLVVCLLVIQHDDKVVRRQLEILVKVVYFGKHVSRSL